MSEKPRVKRSLPLVKLALTGALALPTAVACSSADTPAQYANCVDSNNNVVDSRYCDNPGAYPYGYNIWMSPVFYSPGYIVPVGSRTTYIHSYDTVGRANAGLPPTGKVGGVTVRSGGIGHGSGGDAGSAGHSSGS